MGLLARFKGLFTKSLSPRTNALRAFFGGTAPGLWATNHFDESQQVLDWSFVAVRRKAEQAYQAEMTVTRVVEPRSPKHPQHRAWKAKRQARLERKLGLPSQPVQGIEGARESQTRISPDRQELPRNHRLVKLLRRPSKFQTRAALLFQIGQQLETTGTAYLWAVPGPDGIPAELYVIPTGLAIPTAPSSEFPRGAFRVSPIAAFAAVPGSDADGFGDTGALGSLLAVGGLVDARQVHPIRWPHPIYLSDGLSPLSAGAITVDTMKQLMLSRCYKFQHSVRPGFVFTEESELTPEEKEAFSNFLRVSNSGTQNTGKDLIIPKGIAHEQIESPREVDLDYVQGYQQVRDATLAINGCTPIAAGIAESGSYAALYAGLLQWQHLIVEPFLQLIANELSHYFNRYFAGPGEELEISLRAKSFTDEDIAIKRNLAKQQDIKMGIGAKCLRRDEVRAYLGLDPIGGPEGEEFVGEVKEREQVGKSQQGGNLGGDATESATGVDDPVRDSMPKHVGNGYHKVLERNGHG